MYWSYLLLWNWVLLKTPSSSRPREKKWHNEPTSWWWKNRFTYKLKQLNEIWYFRLFAQDIPRLIWLLKIFCPSQTICRPFRRLELPPSPCIDLISGPFKSNNVLKFHTKRFKYQVTDFYSVFNIVTIDSGARWNEDFRASLVENYSKKNAVQLFIWGSFNIGSRHFTSEM